MQGGHGGALWDCGHTTERFHFWSRDLAVAGRERKRVKEGSVLCLSFSVGCLKGCGLLCEEDGTLDFSLSLLLGSRSESGFV